jgi:RimJ/RimL family protein N-acetyltransferase
VHTDEANHASAAVPAKLGYRLDRIEDVPPVAPAETGRRQIWVYRGACRSSRRST